MYVGVLLEACARGSLNLDGISRGLQLVGSRAASWAALQARHGYPAELGAMSVMDNMGVIQAAEDMGRRRVRSKKGPGLSQDMQTAMAAEDR